MGKDGRTPTEHNFESKETNGRFPANLILDEFMANELDKQSGVSKSVVATNVNRQQRSSDAVFNDTNNGLKNGSSIEEGYDDFGGASRFFYTAKADNFERNKGLKNFEKKAAPYDPETKGGAGLRIGRYDEENPRRIAQKQNVHPTVKPIDLMRYLVRLITPKGGIVLDPFNGSGTTGIAAKMELMKYVGIEMDEEYCKISEARIAAWNPDLYKPQELF